MSSRTLFSILLVFVGACAWDDGEESTTVAAQSSEGGTAEAATTETDGTTAEAETEALADSSGTAADSSTALVRFAQMSVEQQPVVLCIDGEPVQPLGATAVAYPEVTAYLTVATDAVVSVAAMDADCQIDPAVQIQLTLDADALSTLVLFGDPGSKRRPLQLQALLDESDVAPPSMTMTRIRNFHTDTDVGTLDIGIEPVPGTQVFLFEDVAYGGVAQASTVSRVSQRGYVNVPSNPPAERLSIWNHGTMDVLGWFATADFPFVGGDTFTVFPAGRALTGIPEAVLCTDSVVEATAGQLLNACEVFVAQPPDA